MVMEGERKRRMAWRPPPLMKGRPMRADEDGDWWWLGEHSEQPRWDELDHDILVMIMSKLGHHELLPWACFVCRSWLAAAIDSVFPPGPVLDLGPVDSISGKYLRNRCLHFVILLLRRSPSSPTKLVIPIASFKAEAFLYIVQRLPALKCLVLPRSPAFSSYKLLLSASYLKNLEQVLNCDSQLLKELSIHCKLIHTLSLYGGIRDADARVIATNFPLLKHLTLESCALSINALLIILDGQRNLTSLNTKHSYCREERNFWDSFAVARAVWNEEEIREKATGIEMHLQCARKQCPECSGRY